MNRVTMTGRLGQDPELRKTSTGKSVVNASVAVYAGKSQTGEILTEWFRWVVWGDQADRFAQKAHKGDTVMLDGRAVVKKSQKNGVEFSTIEFTVSDFMIQQKEIRSEENRSAVVTSVRPSDYNFEDFPNDYKPEPVPWE